MVVVRRCTPGRFVDQYKYVAQENVRRFRRELENGAEGKRREMLLRLLVEEEDKVGLTYEQLNEIQLQIRRINQIISTQLETITVLKAAGQSVERAEWSLSNAVHLLATHEAYRAKIEAALFGLENALAVAAVPD
jgi:DNA polymerase II large subunit